MSNSAALGRAALGQKDTLVESPYFIGTPYIIRALPGAEETSIRVSIPAGTTGDSLIWGVDEQSGCGMAYFDSPTVVGEETQGEYENILYFKSYDSWAGPYRLTIFVTDGNRTIRESVFIYYAGIIVLPSEISMDKFSIYLADKQFNLGAQIENYTDAVFVSKFNDVGTFSITVEASDIPMAGWGEDGSGTYGNIILTRNREPIFWGAITEFERNWDERVDELILRGEDTMRYLKTRVALPDPNRALTTIDGYEVPIYYESLYDVRPAPSLSAVTYSGTGNLATEISKVKGGGATVFDRKTSRRYRVWICKKGTDSEAPDKFAWKELESGNSDTDGITITGKAQAIDGGIVTVQFSKINGFTLGNAESNYWTFTFLESNMNAEEVIKSYVNSNLGANALAFRTPEGFTVESLHSPSLGNPARGRARFDNLLELLQDIALPNLLIEESQRKPVHFYMDGLTFRVREVADLTDTIVLSKDLGNLKRFSYTSKASTGNYVYVGGKGSEGEREIIEWGNDEGSIPRYGLIEEFIDANSGEAITDLYATAIEHLAKSQDNTIFEAEPFDKPHMKLIDDYWVGDKVTAIVDGSEFKEVIREATITMNHGEGVRITPVIGTPDTRKQELITLYKTIRKLTSRLGGLERR